MIRILMLAMALPISAVPWGAPLAAAPGRDAVLLRE